MHRRPTPRLKAKQRSAALKLAALAHYDLLQAATPGGFRPVRVLLVRRMLKMEIIPG
jgi:hypothetical protein